MIVQAHFFYLFVFMLQIIFHIDNLIYIEFLFKLNSHLINLVFQTFHFFVAYLILYLETRKTFPFILHSIYFALNLVDAFLKLWFNIIIILKNLENELIICLLLKYWVVLVMILDIEIVKLKMLHRFLLVAIKFDFTYIFLFVIAEILVGLHHSFWISLEVVAWFWVLRGELIEVETVFIWSIYMFGRNCLNVFVLDPVFKW